MIGITESLFGVAPSTPRQDFEYAAKNLSGLSASQIGGAQLYSAGRQLGKGLMKATGIEDPEMASANKVKAATAEVQQKGINTQTSQGMKAVAQLLNQQGESALAFKATQVAQLLEEKEASLGKTKAETELREAQTKQAEAGKLIQVDAGNEIQLIDPFTREVVRKIPKGLTPAQSAKQSEEGGIGQPGPVGKAGAFRDATGMIYGTTEMKNIRTEFEQGQKLLGMLNDVTAKDIKDAKSPVDWTTKSSEFKTIASSKTLKAQTKLAASQLVKQIESLPPGSASNADMQAAMKDFPGYSDDEALAAWVNRTKGLLQRNIDRLSDNFGFKPRVTSSGSIDLKAKPGSSRENPIKLD